MSTREQMDGVEIASFLDRQHTGVLSLADEDDSYAVPVSFAYAADEGSLYFRFGFAPGSQKRAFIDATDSATFVVYDHTDTGWQSVVARGRLEQVAESRLDAHIREAVGGLDIPYFQVHERPATDLDFELHRFDVTKITGIAEGRT